MPAVSRDYAETAEMHELVLPELKKAFVELEAAVPPPQPLQLGDAWAYRFVEKLPQQAIVLKFFRVVTGIQSTWTLLNAGYTQEAAALQRILDELGEDIMFLSGPLTIGVHEGNHDRFLQEFFQEEFDPGKSAVESRQNRDRVPRRRIRAYNARTFNAGFQVHETVAILETVGSAYSGFVHAAGVHAMDAYGGEPPHFHIEGMNGTSRLDEACADFRNYLHRSLTDAGFASKALGREKLFQHLLMTSDRIAKQFATVRRRS